MKDIYVLLGAMPTRVLAAADDFDRVSMEMAKYSAADQKLMRIENVDLLEEGD